MRADRVTAGLVVAALTSSSALAAPKPGENVSVAACARPGVEASCLMINGADGTVFNITSANPKPPRDVIILADVRCEQQLGGLLKHYYRKAA